MAKYPFKTFRLFLCTYSSMEEGVDYSQENRKNDMLRRAIKYIVMSIAFAIALKYVPSQKMSMNEIIILVTIGASIFAILDMYCPAYQA